MLLSYIDYADVCYIYLTIVHFEKHDFKICAYRLYLIYDNMTSFLNFAKNLSSSILYNPTMTLYLKSRFTFINYLFKDFLSSKILLFYLFFPLYTFKFLLPNLIVPLLNQTWLRKQNDLGSIQGRDKHTVTTLLCFGLCTILISKAFKGPILALLFSHKPQSTSSICRDQKYPNNIVFGPCIFKSVITNYRKV